MKMLSNEANLVHKTLLSKGLENPTNLDIKNDNNYKKHMITKYITKIMNLLNLDLNDDSLIKTPNRIASMYIDEIFSGLNYLNFPKITFIKNKMKVDEMIIIKNIVFTSTCEHHFIMIDGKATVAYIPKEKIIGISKINRIVQFFAQRPQIQERLVKQILIALQTLLDTKNVAVSINAIHFCVKARGIKDTDSSAITTSLGGLFKFSYNTRQEFLRILL